VERALRSAFAAELRDVLFIENNRENTARGEARRWQVHTLITAESRGTVLAAAA
jgi:Trk K+ transport system NAD-binding subunit